MMSGMGALFFLLLRLTPAGAGVHNFDGLFLKCLKIGIYGVFLDCWLHLLMLANINRSSLFFIKSPTRLQQGVLGNYSKYFLLELQTSFDLPLHSPDILLS